jgi:hypothetical protein
MNRDPIDHSDEMTGESARRIVDARSARLVRSTWIVHLGLLLSAAGALVTLEFLHVRIAIHTDVGLAFAGLVLVHLAQRRRTIAQMVTQLSRARAFVERRIRLGGSVLLLGFITLSVLVSGILDWSRGTPVPLPLPRPFSRWHLLSGFVLVIYLVVHVWRRRKRLRRSVIY